MPELSPVEKLNRAHDVSRFDCGRHPSLNQWLQKFALQNQANDSARTFVLHHSGSVVGYYSISAGNIERSAASVRAAQGLANHPVPIVLLGRLAVDHREQGLGLGATLLQDALLRVREASDTIGIRAVLVHALDDQARSFYERFEFERCPGDPLHLMLLLKDIRKRNPR